MISSSILRSSLNKTAFDLVVIVTSVGGLDALSRIFSILPGDFPVPIAVVQHIAEDSPMLLADILKPRTELSVKWAEETDQLLPGTVYIAPPKFHLLVNAKGGFTLSDTPRVKFVRPSGDLLFESAALIFKNRLIGIVLTGRDGDGSLGIKAVKRMGGITLAQDKESSQASSMPENAIETGDVDFVLPVDEIAAKLMELVTISTSA
jgi:two-component system chemotaxis response regulator CheB